MTIGEIIRQGFYYARTCRSLWLFGFFVGVASGGSSSGTGGGDGATGSAAGAAVAGDAFGIPAEAIAAFVLVGVLVIVAAVVMRFVSEGALIEGVVRTRRGGSMTMREGFRAGWTHWGVLLRIAVLYLVANLASLAIVAAPLVIALRAVGPIGAILLGVPVLIVAVPWLVTLYLVQAFASRIAVLERRHAIDAIAKARLFLHGRLMHGLKLMVATFVGTLAIVLVGVGVVVPVVLLLVALVPMLSIVPVVVLGGLVLLPALYVVNAMVGTLRSSIWTVGYVTEAES